MSLLLHAARARFFNLQSRARAFEIGERHYDLGNDLYEAMLDKRLNYTCGYWKDAANLDEATGITSANDGTVPPFKVLDPLYDIGAGAFLLGAVQYDIVAPGVTHQCRCTCSGRARPRWSGPPPHRSACRSVRQFQSCPADGYDPA